MSATKQKLLDDMKSAMKSGEKRRLEVIRMLIAEIKNAEINDPKEPGRARTEAEAVTILANYHKALSKTMLEYPADRQAPLKEELSLVEEYLPKRLTPDELKTQITVDLKQNPERNFGILMKTFQTKFGAQTDGKTLSDVLKQAIQELG